jgi:phage I-like protein
MSKFEKQVINQQLKNSTELMNLAIPDKYSHIDFTPPKGAQEAAKRALDNRAKKPSSQRGMTPIGIARARDLINAKQLSPDTVRRMLAYFTRHEVDKQGSTWAVYGKGRQAWDGWGGDAGYTWAKKVVGQMDKADQEYKALSELRPVASLIKGKPFLTLALGDVNSRMNGNKISTITLKDLEEIVRVFYERKNNDHVIIDWNHASSPYASSLSSPDVSMALGQIADLEIKDEGLYAYPLYTAKGAQIVEESEGNLWSSPEFIIGPVYARDGGNKIGDAQLLAVTLTPRPAQSQSKIDRILLTEKLMDQTELQGKSPDELIAMLLEKDALVKQLEAKLSALESEMESSVSEEDAVLVADGEKKDGYAAMSEASVKLMNEMSSKITALNEQVGKLQAEKHGAERKNAIDALLNTGKIAPSEKAVAERHAHQAVNLSEVGHAEASKPISLSEQVRSIQKEKGITFAQALDLFKNENPQAYKTYFGV